MAGRSTLSHTVRLHPARIPEDALGALIRACVAVLCEGRPERAFTDDLMDWAARDSSRRRDLQAREEGDTDEHGCTHPYGEQASENHDGWAPDGTERERPANPETWEANDRDIVGFSPREPQTAASEPTRVQCHACP